MIGTINLEVIHRLQTRSPRAMSATEPAVNGMRPRTAKSPTSENRISTPLSGYRTVRLASINPLSAAQAFPLDRAKCERKLNIGGRTRLEQSQS